MAWQFGDSGTAPATIAIPGPMHNWTQSLPEGKASGIKIQAKHVTHAGTVGVLVTGVTAPNQIQCDDFINATDNWVSQLLFVCSNVAGDVPLWNFQITAFDAATGTMTVTPDCVTGDPQTSVGVGDVLIVWAQATSADANSITNTLWNNSVTGNQFPGSAGMTPGAEKGLLVRILRGTGAGQWRNVTDNTTVAHQISPPWDVIPDTTSLYIVETPDWLDPSESSQLVTVDSNILVQLHTEVPNLPDEVVLVGGYLIDSSGNQTDDEFACYRMIYIFGQPPTVRTLGPGAGPFDILVTDQVVRVDSSANDVALNLLPMVDYQGRGLLVFNIGPNNTVIAASGADVFPDGTQGYTLSSAGGTVRITAGGIYTSL
jgi:hypothetical protein